MPKRSKLQDILLLFAFVTFYSCSTEQSNQENTFKNPNHKLTVNRDNIKISNTNESDDDSKLLKYLYDKSKNYSDQLPIQRIKYSNQDLEVRIWFTYDVQAFKRIIIGKRNNKWSARFISSEQQNRKELILRTPKSGWENLWKLLEEQKVTSNLDDTLVGAVEPFEDSEEVIIESLVKGTYRHYSYNAPRFSQAEDGKRVMKILDLISEELGIKFNIVEDK